MPDPHPPSRLKSGRNLRVRVRQRPESNPAKAGSDGRTPLGVYQRHPEILEDWGEVAALYDLEQPVCRGDEARFWCDEATAVSASADQPVMELAAGSGRVTLPIARRGHTIVGLELSDRMLARAIGRTERLPTAVRDRLSWIVGDMATFDLATKTFSLIFIAFNSFWLLDDAAQDACLQRIRSHLRPGGRIVLDLFPPNAQDYTDEEAITQFLPRQWHGRTILRVKDYRYNPATNRAVSDVRYYGTDKTRLRPASVIAQMRYVLHPESPAQVEARLIRAGFTLHERYGSYSRAPIDAGSTRAIFVAGLPIHAPNGRHKDPSVMADREAAHPPPS